MSIKSKMFSRHYFLRLLFSIVALTLLILIVFSFILYFNVENLALKNQYENSILSIKQLDVSINYINDSIKKLLNYTYYFNPDAQYLLYNKDTDMVNSIISANRLLNLENSISFLHSICIYNSNSSQWFTTKGIYERDVDIDNLIKSYKGKVPLMYPIMRYVSSPYKPEAKELVFSYIVYENSGKGNIEGLASFNIKSDWLFANINAFNLNEKDKKNAVFIIDAREQNIYSPLQDNESDAIRKYYKDHLKNKSPKGYFLTKLSGEKYLISYSNVENLHWTVFRIQPLSEINMYIDKVRFAVFLITLLFIFLSVLISATLAKKLYNPIGSLYENVRHLSKGYSSIVKNENELIFLGEMFKVTTEIVTKYNKIKSTPLDIMKNYYIRKVLMESSSTNIEEYERVHAEGIISINVASKFIVLLVQIDNFLEFLKYDTDNRNILNFAIMNVISETISNFFPNEGISLKENQTVFLMQSEGNQNLDKLILNLNEAQKFLNTHYNLSITISISTPEMFSRISYAYSSALNLSAYRFFTGKMSIIHEMKVINQMNMREFNYPQELEKRFIRELKALNVDKASEVLSELFRRFSNMSYNNAILSINSLTNTIASTITETNSIRIEAIPLNLSDLAERISMLETLDEVHTEMKKIVHQLNPVSDSNGIDTKKLHIVETVKEMIHQNYLDNNLCLQQIASSIKISTYYLSKLFKEATNISVNEYINEYRLDKALELMESTTLSINEIISRVGLENVSYFYKLFKQKHGATPKEYILKKSLNSQMKDNNSLNNFVQ